MASREVAAGRKSEEANAKTVMNKISSLSQSYIKYSHPETILKQWQWFVIHCSSRASTGRENDRLRNPWLFVFIMCAALIDCCNIFYFYLRNACSPPEGSGFITPVPAVGCVFRAGVKTLNHCVDIVRRDRLEVMAKKNVEFKKARLVIHSQSDQKWWSIVFSVITCCRDSSALRGISSRQGMSCFWKKKKKKRLGQFRSFQRNRRYILLRFYSLI